MTAIATVLIIKEEMLTVGSTIVVPTSLQDDKMAAVTSLLVLDPLSMLLIIDMRKIELGREMRFHTRGNISCGKSLQSLKQAPRLSNQNLESLPTLYGMLEWSQGIGNYKGEQEMYISSQGLVKKETKKSSIVEESQRAIELLQVKEVVGALLQVYVANEDSCDFKRK
ncbi:hypothetical protein M9H77_30541 [Catharanthus roseus]|uniref:Uncharacterized protein n=1 Tax=Catharanthus roseus TaxID=4058 RepID=A0ACB9ZZL6_CATRO|nr:hypothetical protein M9H77_30541 [Catharanthus roseus]